jgi:predicted DNA-binding transcriptional regulator YafY
MRRADRLFQIIQILRRSKKPVIAADIAREVEVSRRTIYRDIADLIGQRVPIQGEAGFGYVLSDDYDMPPLMLTPDEIEAVVLGAQWVAGHADPVLANAARDLIAKVASTVPDRLKPFIAEPSVGTKPGDGERAEALDPVLLREAIRQGRRLTMTYRAEDGETSRRTIWPVILGYADTTRLMVAWCELRGDFRHFRTDRIIDAEVLDEAYPAGRGNLFRTWQRWRERQEETRRRGAVDTDPPPS